MWELPRAVATSLVLSAHTRGIPPMQARCWIAAVVGFGALGAGPQLVAAQEPARIALERYSLTNGLTVILAPDRTSQVVAVDVWYNVGSRNEVLGRSGFAAGAGSADFFWRSQSS